ncbi:hypothetical protein CI238_00603 [Colletotrichum incanum]|uniref:C2H2-type domain-containing protein n=1 Tax=Colletotrichum incanum TaxID=1573173 RepID=A0A166M5A3_COLIC|nr:hypothetical protein CI238_00603 [Colletotrichum incanum]
MSRLGWQPVRGIAATAWPSPRKDHFSQSSARLQASIHPLKKCSKICGRVTRLHSGEVDKKTNGDSGSGQSKPSLHSANAPIHVHLAAIARLVYVEGILVRFINNTVKGSLTLISPIILCILNIHADLSAFLYLCTLSLHVVIGRNQYEHVAESASFSPLPTTSRRQTVSTWLIALTALSLSTWSRLQGSLSAHDNSVTERKGTRQKPTSGRNKAGKGKSRKTSVRRSKKQADRLGVLHPRKPPNGNESESNSEPEPLGSKAKTRKSKSKRLRFACPYLKWDPFHHLKCLCQHQESSRRVKQHLLRTHQQSIHCPICYRVFEMRMDCDEHVRAGSCIAGMHSLPEGMTQDQQAQLEGITANSEDGKWFAMWDILFPGAEHPGSPYVDPENLGEFIVGEVHRWSRPMYRELLHPFMDDDQFEQHFTSLVHNSNSFLSAFPDSLASSGLSPPVNEQRSSSGVSLGDEGRTFLEEPPNTATQGSSRALSRDAVVRQTLVASSSTLPDGGRRLHDNSSQHNAASPTAGLTGNVITSQQTMNGSEDTVGGMMLPEGMSQFMWTLTAGQFPTNDNSQYANTLTSAYTHQQANSIPSTRFFDDFGVGPINPQPNLGYSHAHQVYNRGISQHRSLADGYESYSPQQLRTTANLYYASQPQEVVAGLNQTYTPQPTNLGATPEGLMDQNGDGIFTQHVTSSRTAGFHDSRHQSAGHASGPVDADISDTRRRWRQSQYENSGFRHS